MSVRRVQQMPTASWLLGYLGREIRVRRELGGLTQADLGERTYCSPKLISAIESGVRVPQPAFISLADSALAADHALVRLWQEMTDGRVTTPFQWYLRLEEQATRVCHFEPQLIPGLLQIERYARASYEMHQPPLSKERIDELVERRIARQDVLTREDAPEVWMIVDEAVFGRWPSDHHVVKPQLEHMLAASKLPNLTLQVVPFVQGHYSAMQGVMTLLAFEDGDDCGYVEPVSGGQIIYDPTTVATMRRRYDLLRAEALPPAASARLIHSLLEDL
ncbi:helix-turn-helix transcriptional regulator [Embleya sp. NBC_00896]|uniref:helix-turn-helix domain-containing protein n=1 Tax=Embleya sp. NBC_00896 TaxID=2975961 RepID=UPI002F90AFBD|nr:helix-turn-helix domain-containing protein [Embleya sp. NBC_00896]